MSRLKDSIKLTQPHTNFWPFCFYSGPIYDLSKLSIYRSSQLVFKSYVLLGLPVLLSNIDKGPPSTGSNVPQITVTVNLKKDLKDDSMNFYKRTY